VGVSRSGKKFSNTVFRDLLAKGYEVFAINPQADTINGDHCYPDLASLPKPVGGVVMVVPPAQTERVLPEVAALGIKRVWLQQGSESAAALEYCSQQGISVIHGECIMMFAEPAALFHRLHRGFRWLCGKLP
jgi:hypothetical protein